MDNPETLDNIEFTRHRTKTNKVKHTTQKTKKMSNTNPTTYKYQMILSMFHYLQHNVFCKFVRHYERESETVAITLHVSFRGIISNRLQLVKRVYHIVKCIFQWSKIVYTLALFNIRSVKEVNMTYQQYVY